MTTHPKRGYTPEEIKAVANRLRNHPIAVTDAHAIDDARDMLESLAFQIAAQKREGVEGIQARYRVPGEDWSAWGAVINAIKGTEMELRVVLNKTKNSCEHPSWEKHNNGNWQCTCCGVIGEEQRYLQPDGEPDRVYSIANQPPSPDQDREVSP